MTEQLTQFLWVSVSLWLRCAPLFLLTPYLAFGVLPIFWGLMLSWAFAGSLAPIVLAGCHAQPACPAALSWSGAALELLAGVVVAFGFGLPGFVLRTTGSIAQALGGSAAAAGSGSQVGRAAGMVALVVAVSAGALSGVSQWLLQLPLRAAGPELFRSLSDEVVRAFGVGVSLAGPLLLGAILAAVVAGLWGRIASSSGGRSSALLLPWLGIALVSLCVANWLDSVPVLVRAFAQSTTRLLGGLP